MCRLLTGKASDFLKIGVAAAGRGDLGTLQAVLAEKPHWLRRTGSHGRTMLWEAAYRGRLEVVEYLADLGADIDACGCHFTPLLVDISPYCAARHKNHLAVAAFLLDRGAALDIHTSAYLGEIEAVREYLDRDRDLAGAERKQNDMNVVATPLHYAVASRHAEIVSALLESGADPRPHGYFLVRFCIWRDRVDILEALIAAGLDPSTSEPPRSGIANPAMVGLLKAHGVDYGPDHAEGGWPPIVFQSRGDRGGNVAKVRTLIEAGADVNVRNHKGQSALHCAAKAGFVDIVALLLEHGSQVDAQDRQGETPLASALRSTVKDKAKLHDVVRLIVNAGADCELADHKGRSPRAIAGAKRNARVWVDALSVD
ncbi:MAG: ankyrin repeat domain-containing protein [Gammaproteobacteria bacterium]|nr:ankyrin repeat domain-containing protein [Gammaproteobacteria bacterium]MDE0442759.1 ankyrin repeat domain-containing protein [Gammaproteobacteria bacterium]